MTTDPTDLLREADATHAPVWDNCLNACCSGEECRLRTEVCRECGEPWPCVTHRLRDALEEHAASVVSLHQGIESQDAALTMQINEAVAWGRARKAERDEARAALAEATTAIKDLQALRDEQGDRIRRISRDHDTLVYALEQILHIEHGDMDEVATVGRIIAAGIKGFHDAYPIAPRDTPEAPDTGEDHGAAPEHPGEVEHLRAIIGRVRDLRRTAVRDGHASPYLAHMIDQALESLPDPAQDQTTTPETPDTEENPHG